MKKSIEKIKKEGENIAKKLGNGVRYAGPQMHKNKLAYHVFNDDAVTDCSIAANTFKEAKEELIEKRRLFNAPPLIF